MIIKIQRPLMTNGDEPMAFVYDQYRRNINAMIPYFDAFRDDSVGHDAQLVEVRL